MAEQNRRDPKTLVSVVNGKRDLRSAHRRDLITDDVAADADDTWSLFADDRDQSHVIREIHFREIDQLFGRGVVFLLEESEIRRFVTQAVQAIPQRRLVVRTNRANEEDAAVAEVVAGRVLTQGLGGHIHLIRPYDFR